MRWREDTMTSPNDLTRRDFLKLSAAGAAALSLPPGCHDGDGLQAPSPTPSRIFRVDNVPELHRVLPDPPNFTHPGLDAMLRLLDDEGHPFYRTDSRVPLGGPEGIVGPDDVVVVKPNQVAFKYAGTCTDLLRGLIQRIVDHPDGFTGEIVFFDQYCIPFFPNSVNPLYILPNVARLFRHLGHKVSVYLLEKVFKDVAHEGPPHRDGFVDLEADHPDDPICDCLTYPKFTTLFGTQIDFRDGVYNGETYEERLTFINFPVMKNHHWMGLTCCCKNLFGTTETMTWRIPRPERWLRNHRALWETGFLGRLMKRVRRPDLNIVDAIRVVHQPPLGPAVCVPGGWAEQGTLLAGFDPVVLDYYAAKHVLYPIDTRAPCEGIQGNNRCTDPAPCLGNGGHCERANPDLECGDIMDSTFWHAPMGLWIEGGAPVDSLRRYLTATSLALHGEVRLGDEFAEVVRISL